MDKFEVAYEKGYKDGCDNLFDCNPYYLDDELWDAYEDGQDVAYIETEYY